MNERPPRIVYFSTWADGLERADAYLEDLPERDLSAKVSDPADAGLMRLARLDCDWDGECLRCFSEMRGPGIEFEPALVADPRGLLQLLSDASFGDWDTWLILIDQRPAPVAPVIGKLLQAFTAAGGRVLYWAYDDASRNMDCFAEGVAPYLSVLIHDESPIAEAVQAALPETCRTLHLSWMANVIPFSVPLRENPDGRILFLGSQLGVTPHRREQIRALQNHFGDRFTCITDHSVPVNGRAALSRFKVHVCPEGRMFGTPSMSRSHTDRPFWAGCMGQVPISEDSRSGGRLDDLAAAGRILRYGHGDTRALIEACECGLAAGLAERRAIHEHFNRHGVVGPVVAREIASARSRAGVEAPRVRR